MIDHLTEIHRSDWKELKDLYTSDGSKSYVAHTTIDNYIQWFEQSPSLKHVKFYCLNGDYSDGTFAVVDRYCAFVDTFNESDENLTRLLELLDFTKGLWFLSVRSRVAAVIRAFFKERGIDVPSSNVVKLLLHRLPKEKALQFQIEPRCGIELRALKHDCDLEKVRLAWPYGNTNIIPIFDRMAEYNLSVGAFDEKGTMVSWILRYPTGILAALQTDEKFLGQGYASLVTRAISKRVGEQGHDVFSSMVEENTASLNLFRKLGFKYVETINWMPMMFYWSKSEE